MIRIATNRHGGCGHTAGQARAVARGTPPAPGRHPRNIRPGGRNRLGSGLGAVAQSDTDARTDIAETAAPRTHGRPAPVA